MPLDKDFKRLVRGRMEQTGESYTVARQALRKNSPSQQLDEREIEKWLDLLALPDQAGPGDKAYSRIKSFSHEDRRVCGLQGLRHNNWRVRRRSALLLDDLALTDETIVELKRLLRDHHFKVRAAALHTLVCEHCKPEACDIPIREIAESMLDDPNAKVRAQALGGIAGWVGDVADERALATISNMAEKDPSSKVRGHARGLYNWHLAKRRGDEARLSLPEDVRAKVNRHPGKWVAVSEGTVIAAADFMGPVHRAMKGMNKHDATVCWVPSSP